MQSSRAPGQIKKLEQERRHLKDQQLLNQTVFLPFREQHKVMSWKELLRVIARNLKMLIIQDLRMQGRSPYMHEVNAELP